jgi:hypothetical protein
VHVHSGERSDEMFLKSCDGSFGSIDSMVVRRDEVDANVFRPDVFFDCGRTFVVHHVQCRVIAPCFEGSNHVCECRHHGCICARWHGAHDDCIEIINICNEDILHTFERANRECTGDVSVHCSSDVVG